MSQPQNIEEEFLGDETLSRHADHRRGLFHWLDQQSKLSVLTLGPQETSSCHAARYFLGYLKKERPMLPTELRWKRTFDLAHESFLVGEGDLLLVPNAYERITDMYWSPRMEFLYCLCCETPAYGLAVSTPLALMGRTVRVAACPAVLQLASSLGAAHLKGKTLEPLVVSSTAAAAEAVAQGTADLAVTNEPGGERFGLEFITPRAGVQMLWSLFKRRNHDSLGWG